MDRKRLRVAVLLSGTGRSLENLLECRNQGNLDIDIPLVISSRASVRGVEIAREAGIETQIVSRRHAPTPEARSAAIRAIAQPLDIDLYVLGGYLLQLEILPEWEGRMLNIHPSLLPLFGGKGMYGHHVHQAVLQAGMKVSGCSVHIVNAEYDAGPIVAQRCVPVRWDDTVESLGARVFEAECLLYPEAIQYFADDRIQLGDTIARVLPKV